MELKESIIKNIQFLRDEGYSWRAIAIAHGIPKDFENLRRIYKGDDSVGIPIIKRVALAMGIIQPRPKLHAWRPVLNPDLKDVASNTGLDELLEAMKKNEMDTDDVLMLIRDESIRQSQRY